MSVVEGIDRRGGQGHQSGLLDKVRMSVVSMAAMSAVFSAEMAEVLSAAEVQVFNARSDRCSGLPRHVVERRPGRC